MIRRIREAFRLVTFPLLFAFLCGFQSSGPLFAQVSLAAISAPVELSAIAGEVPLPNATTATPREENTEMLRPVRGKQPDPSAEPGSFSWHGSAPDLLVISAPAENALVRRYIAQYTSPAGKKWLEAVMKRGEPYLAHIRASIAGRGLPPELAYLPVIESAFLPGALSKSGASGLWQFMKNSISPATMKIDDWRDDRRDFWKSTDAALRKLEENHRYFGDWPLALAAYNAGLGAVKRAVETGKSKDYWDLSARGKLKTETIHYVPKFIAVATILSRSESYGLDLGWPESPDWTRIKTGRTADLGLLAELSGVDVAALRLGNAELRYGVTPPDADYLLKVPIADAPALQTALARKDVQFIRYYFHAVRSGDTLSALSRHYGVSVDLITRSNPGLSARYLKIGARILVPALKEVGPYVRAPREASSIAFEGLYTVKKGETLWSIALGFDVDPELLAEANGMDLSSILREGRVIKTPIIKSETL